MYVFAIGRRAKAIENALQRYLEEEPHGLFEAEAKDILRGMTFPSVSEHDLISWARDREQTTHELDHALIVDDQKKMPTSLRRRCLLEITREIQL